MNMNSVRSLRDVNIICSLVIVLEVRLVKPNADSESLDYETNGLYILTLHHSQHPYQFLAVPWRQDHVVLLPFSCVAS